MLSTFRDSILGKTSLEIEDFIRSIGYPSYRVQQIFHAIYRAKKVIVDWDSIQEIPVNLREQLKTNYPFFIPSIVLHSISEDQTEKFLLKLQDNEMVETVLMPASYGNDGKKSNRITVCISSQVGCAFGCRFCASGLNGWKRNLTADEIVGQWFSIAKNRGLKIHNIVFMGSGEPLANYENLMRAIGILNAHWGGSIGARKITVSTSGLVPEIRKLVHHTLQLRLAVSLHAADDQLRESIMPINKKYPLSELMNVCSYYAKIKKQMITFEYILIEGINDSRDQAINLAKLLLKLPSKINIIPYNQVDGLSWKRPSLTQQNNFVTILRRYGIPVTLRLEKGHDINAACGQLRRQLLSFNQ